MLDVVSRTAEQVFVPLTVGGGVRSVEDVDQLLRAGADKVGINTAAIARPELLEDVAQRFGNQVVVLSVDARRCRPVSPPRPAMRSPLTGDGPQPVSTPSPGRFKGPGSVPERSF